MSHRKDRLPLFRAEALDAGRTPQVGSITLDRTAGTTAAAIALCVLAVLVIAFVALAPFASKVRASGSLVPDGGLLAVVAPFEGVVREIHVADGDEVPRSGPLLALVPFRREGGDQASTEAIHQALSHRQVGIQQQLVLEDQAARLRLQEASRQVERSEQALEALREEIRLAQAQEQLATDILRRLRAMQERGLVGALEADREALRVSELSRELADLQRRQVEMRAQLGSARAQVRQLEVEQGMRVIELEASRSALAMERASFEGSVVQTVRAPVSATVAHRLVEPGQALRAGEALMLLQPADSVLHGELLVPGNAVGAVRPGQRVAIRHHAFPHQRFGHFGSTVLAVSGTAVDRSGQPLGPGSGPAEARFRVRIGLDAQVVPGRDGGALLPGMGFDADIELERRPLYAWLIEPLHALRRRP